MTIKRTSSKIPNVYKLEIELSHRNYHIAYFSAIGKVYPYLEEYASIYFPDEVYDILLSRLQLDEECEYGILVDAGTLELIESELAFPIKIYKLKIK